MFTFFQRSAAPYVSHRRWYWWMGGVGLVALIIADQCGWLLVRNTDDVQTYHGRRFQVVRIIDGDTLEIDEPDRVQHQSVTRVRLCGIDCPETARSDQPAEPWARQAVEFNRRTIGQATITLILETTRTRDTFGRLLAHIELDDGHNLNAALLDAGFARVEERWPHSQLSRYAQIEHSARKMAVGMWSTVDSETSSPRP